MKLSEHVEHIRQLIDRAFRNRLGRMGINEGQLVSLPNAPAERKRMESIRDVFIAETGTVADAYEKLVEELSIRREPFYFRIQVHCQVVQVDVVRCGSHRHCALSKGVRNTTVNRQIFGPINIAFRIGIHRTNEVSTHIDYARVFSIDAALVDSLACRRSAVIDTCSEYRTFSQLHTG